MALHHAAAFRDGIEAAPLPFGTLERTLSLSARAGVLRDMPAQVATRLRALIDARVVKPSVTQWPWLGETLRVL